MKLKVFFFFLFIQSIGCRRHTLKLKNDARKSVICSKFGFLKKGYLSVNIEKFQYEPADLSAPTNNFGFTLDKASTSGISSYLETKLGTCVLHNPKFIKDSSLSVVFFRFNFNDKRIDIERIGRDLNSLRIFNTDEKNFLLKNSLRRTRRASENDLSNLKKDLDNPDTIRKDASTVGTTTSTVKPATNVTPKPPKSLPNIVNATTGEVVAMNGSIPFHFDKTSRSYFTKFVVSVGDDREQGFYTLYFHSCHVRQQARVNITLSIVEKNAASYLAAGEQPLPYVYFAFCVFYFVLGCFWFYLLRNTKDTVYRMHYMMLLLTVVKSIALLFHGVNFYVLGKHGIHEEGWAVMYYITHLMKGALLFITIVLIGTGWTFIKHMLSKREKRIFLFIIPLQILANVATIIIEESEEGNSDYTTWKDIFILVDLLCCGSILFPVVWSIKHLQDASQTDGKAAINLNRLKLFRQFYILIVCYIYFTRIIVYLLNITVPFQWTWLVELFREGTTAIFFVLTGMKFRPASDNPYMRLAAEDLEDEDEVVEMDRMHTQSGALDNVVKIVRRSGTDTEVSEVTSRTRKSSDSVIGAPTTVTVLTDRDTRENSHTFD